ncbi:MAG: hypothetical protein OES38_13975, partial [Gammaproteobacteria bacterium]|nr:hypothetical protein [Gammaproteobacteria bacterium]
FLTVAHNKFKHSNSPPAAPSTEEFYATRVLFDIESNLREVIDALDRIVMRYHYDMLGNRIHQASMESGEQWMLSDVAAKPLYAWDSRDHRFRTIYDQLRRQTDSLLREGAGGYWSLGAIRTARVVPTRKPAICAAKSLSSAIRPALSPATITTSKATRCVAGAGWHSPTRPRWTGRPPCRWNPTPTPAARVMTRSTVPPS